MDSPNIQTQPEPSPKLADTGSTVPAVALGGAGSTVADDAVESEGGIPGSDRVPGFTIVRELGRGGMGVVYLARQHAPKRLVALKVVLAGSHAGAAALERFRLEGEAVARLGHPGVVQVFACGEANGVPYIALELIDGPSLDQVPMPMPPRKAAELLVQVSRAIQTAHEKGIIHRDLKPANILLTATGTPKVTDFGLAKFDPALAPTLGDAQSPTRSGAILGSPRYMAPEQASGLVREIGPATDIHALGIVLYELLTGTAPYEAETVLATLTQIRLCEPAALRTVVPNVPRDLEVICLKCLSKEPHKRYATAAELGDDLERYLSGKPIKARPVPPWERAAKWARRNPEQALVRGIVCFLLPGIAIGIGWSAPLIAFVAVLNAVAGAMPFLARTPGLRVCAVLGILALWQVEETVSRISLPRLRIPVVAKPAGMTYDTLEANRNPAELQATGAISRGELTYPFFLLGAVCGATGSLTSYFWRTDKYRTTGIAFVCGSCGFCLGGALANQIGYWVTIEGYYGSLCLALVSCIAGGILDSRESRSSPIRDNPAL